LKLFNDSIDFVHRFHCFCFAKQACLCRLAGMFCGSFWHFMEEVSFVSENIRTFADVLKRKREKE